MTTGGLVLPHGMGRLHAPDPDDHKFLMRSHLDTAPEPEKPLVQFQVYRRGPQLDQGNTGTCVAHAWRDWLSGEPLMTRTGPTPFELYDQCIKVDEFTDNDHDTDRQMGTSVRAGAKVLTTLGNVKSYLWAFNVDDVRRWILGGKGGVVFGINWYRNMFNVDHEGFARIGGPIDGGHAIYGFGADDRNGFVMIQNSWGNWGGWPQSATNKRRVYSGCAKISYDDLARLFRENAEAATAVEQRVLAR